MRIDLRWQLLLAAICIALLVSVLGYQVQSAGLCSTRVPATGGQIVEGMVGRPRYLNPLLSSQNPVDDHLTDLIFDGLVRYGPDGAPMPALAGSWEVSEDGLTFTFDLREDARWHDGQPVTASDVAFTYGLLQDEDFPTPSTLRELWQAVVISPTTDSQISFTLPQSYGPFIDATTTGILPEHVLGDVSPEAITDHPFNRSPVGTGPFMVVPGTDWQRSGYLSLAPNPLHWRSGVQVDSLEFRFFEDVDSLVTAIDEGDIQAISSVPEEGIAEVGVAEGMRLFSTRAPRYSQLLFNLTESGADVVSNLSIRQAVAMALDREALIDRALNGQGLILDGPYLPQSWAYIPGKVRAYDHQPEAAIAQLEAAGWLVPEGASVREKDGQQLVLRLLLVDEARSRALAAAAAEQLAAIGVSVELLALSAQEYHAALSDRDFDLALTDVEPSSDPDLYDFWSQEAIIRGQNYGGWNNRLASEALENARRLSEQDAREPYYAAFLEYFDNDLPALTIYQHVYTYGLSETVQQVEIGRVDSPRDRYEMFDQWFLLFREVAVPCPDDETL